MPGSIKMLTHFNDFHCKLAHLKFNAAEVFEISLSLRCKLCVYIILPSART